VGLRDCSEIFVVKIFLMTITPTVVVSNSNIEPEAHDSLKLLLNSLFQSKQQHFCVTVRGSYSSQSR
jgi:hypothetical protein